MSRFVEIERAQVLLDECHSVLCQLDSASNLEALRDLHAAAEIALSEIRSAAIAWDNLARNS